MRNVLNTEDVLSKVSLLANTGVDVNAFHTVEFDMHFDDEHTLSALTSDLLKSAPSTYTKIKQTDGQETRSCRLRVGSYLFEKNMDITIFWINDLASRHHAFIANWRVVLKA
tara:strand:+ start:100 stop:435 length:336 start_codon:yes stop_codon:yes gene_type:complete